MDNQSNVRAKREMYIRRPNSSVLACSAATRRGHGHNIPAVAGIDGKNFNVNADTIDVTAALPIVSASGNDKLRKPDCFPRRRSANWFWCIYGF